MMIYLAIIKSSFGYDGSQFVYLWTDNFTMIRNNSANQ